MDEPRLRAEVLSLAEQLGVLAHYCRDSRRCDGPRGLPDLLLAGPGGLALAELKAGGALEPAQAAWRNILRAAGVTWHLWTPASWYAGAIRRELERLARPGA